MLDQKSLRQLRKRYRSPLAERFAWLLSEIAHRGNDVQARFPEIYDAWRSVLEYMHVDIDDPRQWPDRTTPPL